MHSSTIFILAFVSLLVCSNAQIIGQVEFASPQLIGGWACDLERPNRQVTVRAAEGNNLLGITTANLFRPDIASCRGNSYHGFEIRFSQNVMATLSVGTHTVSVQGLTLFGLRIALSGSPVTIQLNPVVTVAPSISPTMSPTASPTASPTTSPTTSPTQSPTASPTASPTTSPSTSPTTSPTASPSLTAAPAVQGALQSVNALYAKGWACQPQSPTFPITVNILVDNASVGSALANLETQDPQIGSRCGGNTTHGFQFTLAVNDGNIHSLKAVAVGVTGPVELSGSPMQFQAGVG